MKATWVWLRMFSSEQEQGQILEKGNAGKRKKQKTILNQVLLVLKEQLNKKTSIRNKQYGKMKSQHKQKKSKTTLQPKQKAQSLQQRQFFAETKKLQHEILHESLAPKPIHDKPMRLNFPFFFSKKKMLLVVSFGTSLKERVPQPAA